MYILSFTVFPSLALTVKFAGVLFVMVFILFFLWVNILKRIINCSTNVSYQKGLSSGCEETSSPCIHAGGNHEQLTEADRNQVGNMENWIECDIVGDKKGEFGANAVKFLLSSGRDAFETRIIFTVTSAFLLKMFSLFGSN